MGNGGEYPAAAVDAVSVESLPADSIQRLTGGVLSQALRDAERPEYREDVLAFFFSDETEKPFCFLWCLEVLGIPGCADRIRRLVLHHPGMFHNMRPIGL